MFGDRFQRSLEVARQSYGVLKANPSLAFFPVISGLASFFVSIPFLVAIWANAGLGRHTGFRGFDAIHYVLLALMYFCTYFVVIFFNSALVACANENLQGLHADMGFGLKAATRRLPQILAWTAVSSTVGLILRFISERAGVVGDIIAGILGLAWNIAVYFVVPVLVVDGESPFAAIKTSTGMIKRTWGESLMLGVGIGTIVGLLCLVGVIPMVAAVAALVANIWMLAGFLFLFGLMIILVVSVAGSAMTSIYQTALYLYCRSGQVPAGFSRENFQYAFVAKPRRGFFGR